MKKVWITILGILNLIAFVSMLFLLGMFLYATGLSPISDFILFLPFIAVAVYTLTLGIFTLKGKHWVWTVFGPIFATAAWLYFFVFTGLFQVDLPFGL